MIFKRKAITAIVLIFCICVLCLFTSQEEEAVNVSTIPDSRPQIILDAGHAALENTIDYQKSIAK